jgi:hypothetical protein
MFRNLNLWSRIATLLLMSLSGCAPDEGRLRGDVVQSISSPNGSVVASVTKTGMGATVPFVYRVYLRQSGSQNNSELLRADNVSDIRVTWESDQHLVISMPCGSIFQFVNFFDVLDRNGEFNYRIGIRLDTSGICPNPK